jgi:hypothetical protein
LGVFLDIEGPFNITCYDTMYDALVRHGSEYIIVLWIRATMDCQLVVSTLIGYSMGLTISRSCPHGGLVSPFLWCLVLDDLITMLSGGGVFIQGYADNMSSHGG